MQQSMLRPGMAFFVKDFEDPYHGYMTTDDMLEHAGLVRALDFSVIGENNDEDFVDIEDIVVGVRFGDIVKIRGSNNDWVPFAYS